jgi:hypothetical protein
MFLAFTVPSYARDKPVASPGAMTEVMRELRPGEFPLEAASVPPAPGAVEPEGWLRDWAMFNAGPAPLASDFRTMSYYQSPNRIGAGFLPADQPDSPGVGCHLFTPLGYPPVLCCVAAANRLLPNYVMHLWMATADRGLAATLYGPCQVSAVVGAGTPSKLTCRTAVERCCGSGSKRERAAFAASACTGRYATRRRNPATCGAGPRASPSPRVKAATRFSSCPSRRRAFC